MTFVINDLKYNTDKMEKVADVEKWYQVDNLLSQSMFPGKKLEGYMIANYGEARKEVGC